MTEKRTIDSVMEDLNRLVNKRGYIYVLCMIIFEDFHIDPEKIQEIDYRKKLNIKEASLLLGLLVKMPIDFKTPGSPQEMIKLKQETFQLLEELHKSFLIPFTQKMQKTFEMEHVTRNFRKEQKDFFGTGDMLTEAIFYSGTGVYSFQYLDFLEKKYKRDTKWLLENKKYNIEDAKKIVCRIRDILQEKAKKVRLYDLDNLMPKVIEKCKQEHPNEDWEKYVNEVLPLAELHQYVELFFEYQVDEDDVDISKVREKGWISFYKGIIDLFVIRKADLGDVSTIDSFLHEFSISSQKSNNLKFQTVGNYNLVDSHPMIKLDDERYFLPILFSLYEAVYESPFYWMENNDIYRDKASENRGKAGEEITYDFLLKVFGVERIFKSIKVMSRESRDLITDIDVLGILGSKAICVQVKSKKLTTLSRTGSDQQLRKDFQGAVQDAYEQGLISRQRILEKGARFFDEKMGEIKLSEEIDEVYVMVITTENYPSLTFQSRVMLEKQEKDPFPMVTTIFDLEMLTFYLGDPYDFLYYVRQRTSLMDYFLADGEMAFLGFHLIRKLEKISEKDMVYVDTNYGQLVDRNYFPMKAGLKVTSDGDAIKNRWRSENFERLCNRIKEVKQGRATDIIFHLLDYPVDVQRSLGEMITKTKRQTVSDGEIHSLSLPPEDNRSSRVGVTYLALNDNDSDKLTRRLLVLCKARKYRSKGDVWIGLGSLRNSAGMVDVVVYSDNKWHHDDELEIFASKILKDRDPGKVVINGKQAGRNDKCPCGSGLKFKKCCGRIGS